jgi:hypothetical protein
MTPIGRRSAGGRAGRSIRGGHLTGPTLPVVRKPHPPSRLVDGLQQHLPCRQRRLLGDAASTWRYHFRSAGDQVRGSSPRSRQKNTDPHARGVHRQLYLHGDDRRDDDREQRHGERHRPGGHQHPGAEEDGGDQQFPPACGSHTT